jgi:UDP-N-acetylmuramoylalanine--D-glutamate ligase
MNFFLNKKVGILGLSRTGISSIKFLKKKSFDVFGWDDNKKILSKIKKNGLNIQILNKANLKKMTFLLVSPGIPSSGKKEHVILKQARKEKVEIVNDVELFFRFNPEEKYIGVTGTNGKSTTVCLLNHILKKLKINNSLSGNIGKPVFDLKSYKKSFNILEISSFQLESMTRTRFNVAVLLNISKDHIERHENFQKYISEKIKIFNNQSENDFSIIGIDDKVTSYLVKKLRKKLNSKIITISGKNNSADIYVKNRKLIINLNLGKKKVFKKINIEQFKNFLGEHNYQNIAAVYAIILSLGFLDWKKIENSIKSFKILPHRLQKIRKVCDITFINDSKATNIDATDQALKNFNNIYWILGGRIKEKNLQKLKKHFFRIKHVFLVGETKFLYERYLRNFLECTIVKNLTEAVKLSYFLAKEKIKKEKVKPSIILLSPACSSLDEWRDFEERGNAFIKIVKRI